MRDRRHVPNGTHLQTSCLQRTDGRLAPRPRPPHQNITVLHAVLIPDGDGSRVRRLRGGKGGTFPASPKSPSPGGRTGQDIPFPIADGNLRVIEGGLDINTPVEHGLLFFLFGPLGLTFSLRDRSSRYRLARSLHPKRANVSCAEFQLSSDPFEYERWYGFSAPGPADLAGDAGRGNS